MDNDRSLDIRLLLFKGTRKREINRRWVAENEKAIWMDDSKHVQKPRD